MPRERSEKRNKARELWLKSRGEIALKDIAIEIDVPDSKVRKWKSIDEWERKLKGNVPNQKGAPKRNAPYREMTENQNYEVAEQTVTPNLSSNTKGSGAPPGNKNAVGNKGGKGGPHGNNYRHIHGLHSLLKPNALSDAEKAHLLDSDIEAMDELEASVRVCDILIARHINKIEEFTQKEKIPQTLTEKITTVKGIERGLDSDYIQKDIGKSHVYTSEIIDKLHGEIAKQVKIKAGLLKDIEELKLKTGSNTDTIELVSSVLSEVKRQADEINKQAAESE